MKDVTNEYVNSIMEHARWDLAGVKIDKEVKPETKKEDKTKIEESNKESKVEVHKCPLCESELKEAISDEALLEHASQMQEVFEAVENAVAKALNEETDEDLEDSLDSDEDSEDEDSDEDSEDEDSDEDSEDESK